MKRLIRSTIALMLLTTPSVVRTQGVNLPNGGAIHGTLAGTSTAVGCDAVGVLFWNPATISGTPCNEVTNGTILLLPHTGLTSSTPAFPGAAARSGRTNSDIDVVRTTALGCV